MQIHIHCHGIVLSGDEKDYIIRRAMFALGRFSSRLRYLAIRISDTNGTRGGEDKRCRILTQVQGLGELFVEDNDADLLAVVDRSTSRLGHTIARRLERVRMGSRADAFDDSTASPRGQKAAGQYTTKSSVTDE